MNLRARYANSNPPVVTAHRGFSGRYPENTLLAFTKAVELGVDIVEFDVHESADGRLVVIHDALLDRTTDGKGPVDHHTLDELKRLDASFHWLKSFKDGNPPSTAPDEVAIPKQ